MSDDSERTASLMTPAKLAQLRPRPAATPAAWLDQLAADAGAPHVRRLVELQTLQHGVAGEMKSWQTRMAPVASAAADCGQLQEQEKSLAESVATLGEQLRAAM